MNECPAFIKSTLRFFNCFVSLKRRRRRRRKIRRRWMSMRWTALVMLFLSHASNSGFSHMKQNHFI